MYGNWKYHILGVGFHSGDSAFDILRYACARSPKVSVPVAYAGSCHNNMPKSSFLKAELIDRLKSSIASKQQKKKDLKPFIVQGNSMQYAEIKSGDIVFANEQLYSFGTTLPQIVVLSIPSAGNNPAFKIRRTWRIIDADSNSISVREKVEDTLNSPKFEELRIRVADRCPADSVLINEVLDKYNALPTEIRSKKLLLSTTYRTEDQKIGFSLHNAEDLVGVVEYVSSPIAE